MMRTKSEKRKQFGKNLNVRLFSIAIAASALSLPAVLEYNAKANPAKYKCSYDNGGRWIEADIQVKSSGFYIHWKDGFGGPYPDFEWSGTAEDIHNVADTYGKRYRYERSANGFRLSRLQDTNTVDGSGIICNSF